ncbi:MAG: Sua5/YciO/YrdC/YwlC family protein [Gammaproteobacteria bacterium]|nr:MAG: Sua5/YciO/YrdC/YwlC family protein [Gammaproteobacteria bacterium]
MSAAPSHWQLHTAARCIRKGGVVAYPTEAVFGLGCDPANPLAVARLLALKNRPWQKGLILIASNLQQLEPWLQALSDSASQQLNKSWPGPTTWLLPASRSCPDWLTGTHDTLAVRISAHPLVRRLCDILDGPVISTSANSSGQRPARSVLDVRLRFGTQIDFVLPGMLGGRKKPTRIRDLASGKLIRG